MCNIERRHQEEQPSEIILNLDQWLRRKCHLKVFLIWSSGSPFVQGLKHLCHFGRGYQEEQFCEITLNLGQWFRRKYCLKAFLIWISSSPFVQWSVTICAILVGVFRVYTGK